METLKYIKEYTLKSKDIPLLDFRFSSFKNENFKNIEKLEILKIYKDFSKLRPLDLENDIDSLEKFIKNRRIPNNRENFDKIINTLPYENRNLLTSYIDISLALSLNDSYWLVPKNSKFLWKDYNLYNNNFSKLISETAFFGIEHSIKMLTTSPEYTTNGAIKKCWYRYDNGKTVLFKSNSVEYANRGKEAYTEFYTGQVAKYFDFDYVKYDLVNYKGNIVSACDIFTSEKISYVPIFKVLDKKDNNNLEKINEIMGYDFMADMLVFDSLIGNIDRHLGNFGLLRNNDTGEILRPAPIFDNGLSFINLISSFELDRKDLSKYYFSNYKDSFLEGFESIVYKYVNEKHLKIFEKLKDFKIEKHSKYNLDDKWLKAFENFVRENAKMFINIYMIKKEKYVK
ncbi:HipA domain-containing protein [Oceanivirga salmonicida]|uniref:hypothetical protein n=1 Tax=Oceanivirga salmonicida TaxID=1769291 RepID=UPI00082B18AD|nr:hypothetical protein [Oceanivirga salmonicida]